jgi:predicted dehydrogenase
VKKQTMDRRHFLGVSAGASLAACATLASGQEAAASDRIVVGVMGVHGRGRDLALGFAAQPGVEIGYICDVDSRALPPVLGALEKVQQRVPAAVEDFRKILDDSQVNVLAIAAPNHWHAPATILGCSAGKHVYVEKPCSYTAEEGEWAVAAARKHDRVVTMGTQRRSREIFRQAVQRMREGVIGNIRYARSWYANRRGSIGHGQPVPVPEWLNFDLWQGPAPRRPYKDNLVHYNWHWHWHWGNGELGNNGVHALDLARWGMGVDYPARITSAGGRYHFEDDQETPDTHLVTYEFDQRAIMWEGLSCDPLGPDGTAFGVSFHGDQGTLKMFDTGYRIFDMQRNQTEEVTGEGADAEHFADFLRCIREGGRPTADIEEAHKSTLLCHLGNIAQRTGRALRTDPANGHILDDPEAMQLWGREYEPGWQPEV